MQSDSSLITWNQTLKEGREPELLIKSEKYGRWRGRGRDKDSEKAERGIKKTGITHIKGCQVKTRRGSRQKRRSKDWYEGKSMEKRRREEAPEREQARNRAIPCHVPSSYELSLPASPKFGV